MSGDLDARAKRRDPTPRGSISSLDAPSPIVPVSEVLQQLQASFTSTVVELKATIEPHFRNHGGAVRYLSHPCRPSLELEDPIDHFPALETLEERSKARAAEEIERAKQRKIAPQKVDLNKLETVPLEELQVKNIIAPAVCHLDCDVPCQDCIQVARSEKALVVAQSDGATGAMPVSLTHFGAKLLTLKATEEAQRLLQHHNGSLLDPEFLGELHARVYRSMFNVMREIGLHPAQAGVVFAATLQLSISTPKESILLAMSDGVFRDGRRWKSIEDTTERDYKQKYHRNNPPGLVNSIALDAYGEDGPTLNPDPIKNQRNIYLAREAELFHIAGYWATSKVMKRGLELGSDGNGSVDRATNIGDLKKIGHAPKEWSRFFPLDRLISQFSTAQVELAMHLYNLWYPTEYLVKPGRRNRFKVDENNCKHTQLQFINDILGNGAETFGIGEELKFAVKTSAIGNLKNLKVAEVFAVGSDDAVFAFLVNPKVAALEHTEFCKKVQDTVIEEFQEKFSGEPALAQRMRDMQFDEFWDFLAIDFEDEIDFSNPDPVKMEILNYFEAVSDKLALHCPKSNDPDTFPIQHIIEEELKPRVAKYLKDIFGVQVRRDMAPLGDDLSRSIIRRVG